jgi:signal transduction histidine kinase/DNA-binding response OmpR family regulator/ligand-binding sensor domain-containing protein
MALQSATTFKQYVRSIFQDNKNTIWAGTNNGISRFNITQAGIVEIKETNPVLLQLQNQIITNISQDTKGRFWIVTLKEGLKVYDAIKNTLAPVNFSSINNYSFTIKDVCHLASGNQTFITIDGGGLYKLNDDLQITSVYQTNEDDLTTLSNNAAYDILVDSYNRLWVTTYGGGVNVAVPDIQLFNNILHEANNANSLSNNSAKAILEDGNSNLWFGTRKGLSQLNKSNGKWQHFNEELNGKAFSNDNVLFLTSNNKEKIWAGTYGGGIVQVSTDNNHVKHYINNPADSASIGTNYIYAVLYDSKKRLWAGGIRGPLSYLDPLTNRFVRMDTTLAGINCIIETSNGEILVGAEKGVLKVNGTKLESLFKTLVTDKVICILEEGNNTYWVGTQGGGLILVNTSSGIEKIYKSADGLPSDVICGLTKDNNGDLWVGTSRGLVQFTKNSNSFTVYSKADGLAGSQITYGAIYKNKKGEIIVGTTEGFSLFNPERIKIKGFKPKIVFTGLTINNKQISPEDATDILPIQLDELNNLKLKHNQNSFTIDFVNTSPAISGKHLYSWKLEGYDKEWTKPTTSSAATFTNLKSGKYTLVVKTFLKGQQEIAVERRLAIKVFAPWWLTIWAYISYLLLLVALALAIHSYILAKQGRKRYAERLKLNTSISHEIRTPLTLIKAPVASLAESKGLTDDDKSNMNLALKNIEKLERIITQFIDYQKSGFQQLQMQVVHEDILLLLDDTLNSFQPLIKEKNIAFTYDRPNEKIELLFDKDKMEKIFNNLISNSVKYTTNNNQIAVSVVPDAKYVTIHFADTGIGIPEEQQKYIFKQYFRADNTLNSNIVGSGVGLNFTKELVDRHNGKLSFISEKGKGSTFTLKLPLDNNELSQYLVKSTFTDKEILLPEITSSQLITSSENKKILIAEDNNLLRLFLEKSLLLAKYKVYKAENGKQAYDILKSEQIDIVITDVMMPEMNGFQLCSAVKKEIQTCHIPVIMLTAIHDKEYLLEGYRCGADDYVKKPYEIKYLITRIENLLQNRMRLSSKLMRIFEHEEIGEKEDVDVIWLKNVTQIIADNISKSDFSVEKLAALMAMSRPVLFRKFKAIANEAPQQYIIDVRLRYAVELLQKGTHNISEVAYMSGFEDPKYFSTAFKKHFGKSPRDYIQNANSQRLDPIS